MKGLYGKFLIEKTNSTPMDPDAMYFTLRIDNDPDALEAVLNWAKSQRNWLLYHDLERLRDEVINHE